MEKNLEYYMGLPYRVEVVKDNEEDGYALRCPELPGCVTCAATAEEGLVMIEDAKRCWLTAALEDGFDIPEPVKLEEYSGQFKLRIPRSLHRQLAQRSNEEGISMNQYCLYLLSKGAQQ